MIPRRIYAVAQVYEISQDPAHVVEMLDYDPDACGETVFWADRICIRPGMGPMRTRETLLHECLHAALGHSREAIIEGVAMNLLMLMRDNPDLVKYLMGDD